MKRGLTHRNGLHRSKVDEFVAWAAVRGYAREETTAAFQVFRLRRGDELLIFYERTGKDHLTAPNGPALQLVSDWLESRSPLDVKAEYAEIAAQYPKVLHALHEAELAEAPPWE